MPGSLISFFLPLLYLASIGLLIYCVVLLIRSVSRKSPGLRMKALKISILPILYIAGMICMFNWASKRNILRIAELPGTYSYGKDSSLLSISLLADHSFSFSNAYASSGGSWRIDSSTLMISFYTANKKPMGQAAWLYSDDHQRLKFLMNGRPTILVKK